VLIVLTTLMYAVVAPQAFAEKTQGKSGKPNANKDTSQAGQLQVTGTPGSPAPQPLSAASNFRRPIRNSAV